MVKVPECIRYLKVAYNNRGLKKNIKLNKDRNNDQIKKPKEQ